MKKCYYLNKKRTKYALGLIVPTLCVFLSFTVLALLDGINFAALIFTSIIVLSIVSLFYFRKIGVFDLIILDNKRVTIIEKKQRKKHCIDWDRIEKITKGKIGKL